MRLIDADEAKKQISQMQTLKASERNLFRLALDRTPTYEPPNAPLTMEELREMDGDTAAALTAYTVGYDAGGRTYAGAVLEAAERWGG